MCDKSCDYSLLENQLAEKNTELNELKNYGFATADKIFSGYAALIKGNKITGTFSPTALSGTKTISPGASSTTLNGYYDLSNYKVTCSTCPVVYYSAPYFTWSGTINAGKSKTVSDGVCSGSVCPNGANHSPRFVVIASAIKSTSENPYVNVLVYDYTTHTGYRVHYGTSTTTEITSSNIDNYISFSGENVTITNNWSDSKPYHIVVMAYK